MIDIESDSRGVAAPDTGRDGRGEYLPSPVIVGSGFGCVHIRTPPSWLPVAKMKGSATGFQAMHVKSPPRACERI